MPLYDYRCAACGREVEVMHGMDGAGPETCEICGGTMNKVLSPPAIHFKGSGWAKKDAAASSATKAKPKAATTTGTDDAGTSGEDRTTSTGTDDSGGGPSAAADKATPATSASAKID